MRTTHRSLGWLLIVLLVPALVQESRLALSRSSIAQDVGARGDEVFFVSTAGQLPKAGCSSLSVVSLSTGSPVYSGQTIQTFSRIAASAEYTRVIAAPRDGGLFRFHVLDRDSSSDLDWSGRSIRCTYEDVDPFNRGATLLSEDGRLLYTAIFSNEKNHVGIGKFDLEALVTDRAGNLMLDRMVQFYDTEPFIATRAFFAPGPRSVIHFVGIDRFTGVASVQTLDLSSGNFAGAPIQIESMMIPDSPKDLTFVFADLSKGGRYLITNLWHKGGINLIDLVLRTSKVVMIDGAMMTGGVAINRGWENSGMLAVHAADHIQLLHLDLGTGAVRHLSSLPVNGPTNGRPPHPQEPGQVAWSTSGAQLIVSVDHEDSEFLIAQVADGGRRVEVDKYVTVCQDDGSRNYGLDILTCNGEFDEPPGADNLSRCFVPRSVSPTATQQEPSPSPVISPPSTHTPLPPRPVLLPVLANG